MTVDELSVVICTWARPDRLRNCLKSLYGQSRLPGEILVVGVEGDLGVVRTVDEFEGRVPPVTIVWQKGRTGLGHARNLGWSSARGDWIAFIDDDAIADPGWVENLTMHFHDGTDALGGEVRDPENGQVVVHGSYSFRLRTTHRCPAGCNMAFRRSWLQAVGGFDGSLVYGFDDHDVGIKLTLSGSRMGEVGDALVWHRRSWGPDRDVSGPNLPQYSWSGAYLIAKHSDSLQVGRTEHFARLCALVLELVAMGRDTHRLREVPRLRPRRDVLRVAFAVCLGLLRGTLQGLRVANQTSPTKGTSRMRTKTEAVPWDGGSAEKLSPLMNRRAGGLRDGPRG